MNKKLSFIVFALASFMFLPSCIEDDKYGEGLEVYGKGDGTRHKDIEKEEEEEDEGEGGEQGFDFTTLTGTYEGNLLTDPEEGTTSPLDVEVEAKSNKTFGLALRNADLGVGELITLEFSGIPAKKSGSKWTFATKQDVALFGDIFNVDVDGEITESDKELSFVVRIPVAGEILALNYNGVLKK